jgi:hypothetical protein
MKYHVASVVVGIYGIASCCAGVATGLSLATWTCPASPRPSAMSESMLAFGGSGQSELGDDFRASR